MSRIVERLDSKTAAAVICPNCGWRGKDDDPSSGLVPEGHVACPKCHAPVEYEYDEGVRCSNCGAMDYSQPLKDEHGRFCSRRCQFQAEYARSLKAGRVTGKAA